MFSWLKYVFAFPKFQNGSSRTDFYTIKEASLINRPAFSKQLIICYFWVDYDAERK